MKVLNLYCGLGGNRQLWKGVEVTAVEIDAETAKVYSDYFPNDTVIVGDAHEYLLNNYDNFDFIWTSPPCPSHSRINTFAVPNGTKELEFADMKLYQEILFLKHWAKDQKWVVENVIPYYKPLITGEVVDRHLFWANFKIGKFEPVNAKLPHKQSEAKYLEAFFGYDLSDYNLDNKRKNLRNCVHPETGEYILNRAKGIVKKQDTKQLTMLT